MPEAVICGEYSPGETVRFSIAVNVLPSLWLVPRNIEDCSANPGAESEATYTLSLRLLLRVLLFPLLKKPTKPLPFKEMMGSNVEPFSWLARKSIPEHRQTRLFCQSTLTLKPETCNSGWMWARDSLVHTCGVKSETRRLLHWLEVPSVQTASQIPDRQIRSNLLAFWRILIQGPIEMDHLNVSEDLYKSQMRIRNFRELEVNLLRTSIEWPHNFTLTILNSAAM